MSDSATANVPALPSFLPVAPKPGVGGPRPAGIPVAPFAMQKILTKAIRSHTSNQNLRNAAVKGADKMGSPRRSGAKAGGKRSAGRTAKTSTAPAHK
jgi:hypothetical protein